MAAMLAETADIKQLIQYAHDDDYWMEQKLDGHRILLDCDGGSIVARERSGNVSQHNHRFQTVDWLHKIAGLEGRGIVLDGEYMDGEYWVFDVPYCNSVVYPNESYSVRRSVLNTLGSKINLNVVPTAMDTDEKLELLERCIKGRAEGVMIKHRDGEYLPGGRSKKMLKGKFTKTADLVVTAKGVGGKENMTLCAWRDGELVEVGRCSAIGKPHVEVGEVIEVKYLYLGSNNRIVQPTMLKKRPDKEMQECHFTQLVPTNKSVLVSK